MNENDIIIKRKIGICRRTGMDTIKKIGLNSNEVKLIAIIAMTIDHVTWLLFPGCQKIWWVMLHTALKLSASAGEIEQ